MNAAEWDEFAGRLEATFRGGLAEDREFELRRHFGRVPQDLALRALQALVIGTDRGTPQIYMPTASELISALRRVTGSGFQLRAALTGAQSTEEHDHYAAQLNAAGGTRRSP